MQDHDEAILKSLIAVAWADGRVEAGETEVIDALLTAFQISDEDAAGIREYAKTPRTLDDVPLTDLSAHDRRMLLQHAVLVTYIDGKHSPEEEALLTQLVARLHLPAEEAQELIEVSSSRAKKLLDRL